MAFGGVQDVRIRRHPRRISTSRARTIAERGFCAECGTPLTYRGIGSERISVTLGSLDDPDAVEPTAQFGVKSRLRWLERRAQRCRRPKPDEWLARAKIAEVRNRQHPDRET